MRTRHFSSSDSVPPSPRRSSSEQRRAAAFAEATAGQRHQPVLLHEVIHALDIREDDSVVDATLGGGGHAVEEVKGLGGNGLFIGFDLDEDAIERTRGRLSHAKCRVELLHANFRDIKTQLESLGVKTITKALFDLGWSVHALDSGRGFSFDADEPLLMTYGIPNEGDLTAQKIVNEWSEKSIADVIFGFGQERYARRIARAIVERRARRSFSSARDLAETIVTVAPIRYRYAKIHPATRTFQALRIAVNDELGALEDGLRGAFEILREGGRIAVITFHSIEDRSVKRLFLEWEKQSVGYRINKKPIVPTRDETRMNRRSRSAKLRVFEKISHEEPHTKNKQVRTVTLSGKD